MENQLMENSSPVKFTWKIDNFSSLNKKQYSDIFIAGGHKWRILIFPKGKKVDHLSIYLDVADSVTLPYGWSRYVQFSLVVVSQHQNKHSIKKNTDHLFNAEESDWGFSSFMPLNDLYDPSKGYLVNDLVVIEAEILNCGGGDADKSVVVSAGNSPRQQKGGLVNVLEERTCKKESDQAPLLIEPVQTKVLEKVGYAEKFHLPEEPSVALQIADTHQVQSGSDSLTSLVDSNVVSSANTSRNSDHLYHPQLEGQTVNVNGLWLLAPQVEAVKHIFERHPDLASNFRPQNHRLQSAYIDALLEVIEMLCRPPQGLSQDDISYAQKTLTDLEYVGLEVEWVKTKLEDVSQKMEQVSRMDELRKQFKKMKQLMLNLQSQLEKEETETTRAPLSFNDIV